MTHTWLSDLITFSVIIIKTLKLVLNDRILFIFNLYHVDIFTFTGWQYIPYMEYEKLNYKNNK